MIPGRRVINAKYAPTAMKMYVSNSNGGPQVTPIASGRRHRWNPIARLNTRGQPLGTTGRASGVTSSLSSTDSGSVPASTGSFRSAPRAWRTRPRSRGVIPEVIVTPRHTGDVPAAGATGMPNRAVGDSQSVPPERRAGNIPHLCGPMDTSDSSSIAAGISLLRMRSLRTATPI